MTERDFTGKVAYVSGAANGIGRATAVAFARAGAHLALVDIDEDGLAETARLVEEAGTTALVLTADVADDAAVQRAIEQIVTTFGRLDVAFNNAGVEQASGATVDVALSDYDRIMGINVRGMLIAMQHQLPLLERSGGAMVNTSSGAGVIGINEQAVYAASKHAVIGLSRSVALEYAPRGVRVNVIAPGIIETSMMERVFGEGERGQEAAASQEPIGRPGRPEEIASAVLWLCSPDSAFMIGHALVMDGGQTIQ